MLEFLSHRTFSTITLGILICVIGLILPLAISNNSLNKYVFLFCFSSGFSLVLFAISFKNFRSLKVVVIMAILAKWIPIILIYLSSKLGLKLSVSTKSSLSMLISLVLLKGAMLNPRYWK